MAVVTAAEADCDSLSLCVSPAADLRLLCRAASIITGRTAATPCTHTGKPRTTMKTLWCESACTWTSAESGAGRAARRRCRGRCATALNQVSRLSLVTVAMQRFAMWLTLSCPPRSAGSKPFRSETVCPPTTVKFERGCYHFEPVVYKRTFKESREHCRLIGWYTARSHMNAWHEKCRISKTTLHMSNSTQKYFPCVCS